MAFGRDKAGGLSDEAREAAHSGAAIFTPQIVLPLSLVGSTKSIEAWAESITAIESEGWQLVHWSVTMGKGAATAYPLFRRA